MTRIEDLAALDAIHEVLDGREWSPDSLEEIAEILRSVGYVVREPLDS